MSLELVNIEEKDLELIMGWRMNPEITKYMYTDPVLTLEGQKKWLKLINEDNKSRHWLIQMDSIPIGILNITNIDHINKRCLWGYYIGDSSFKGRGIASMLECNIYDYVFENLSLNKLSCEVFSFNEKVVAIHEKFGSKVEGKLKQHIYKNGSYFDVIVMGITRDDWLKIRGNYSYKKINIE